MPVDIAFGTVRLNCEDITIPGKVELVWNRHYSTAFLEKPPTPLGLGWTCQYYTTLTKTSSGFDFITPNGATETLEDSEGLVERGEVIRSLGAFLEIFRQGQRYIVQTWDVESGDVIRYCFKPGLPGNSWNLSSIEDVTGQGLDIKWGNDGQLLLIRQRLEHRELRLKYNKAGLIESVFLFGPNDERHLVIQYEYDAHGRQITAQDAAGFTDRFEYDGKGRLIREIIKDGGIFNYKYDNKSRCVKRSGLDRYDEKRLRYLEDIRITEVTDSYDRKFSYQYLPSGQVVIEIDSLGGQRTTEYDEYGRIIAKTDATGSITRYSFDELGNHAMVTDALGNTTTFYYNNFHQPLTMVDAAGNLWQRFYDEKNYIIKSINPLNNCWWFSYDLEGNITEVINPKRDRKQYIFNNGILQSITDWMGNSTLFTFDVFGRVIERIGALGEITSFHYDLMGHPVKANLPDGATLVATYDSVGNLIRFVDANGGLTCWQYGTCKRLIERVDPTGGSLKYIWGREPGRLDQIINEKGESYRYYRDDSGRIVQEVSFDGADRNFRYDQESYTTEYTNANGETIVIERDALHRVIGQKLPNNEHVSFVFDPVGNLEKAINNTISVIFERDQIGRIVHEAQGEHWVKSQYDDVGNLIKTTTSFGHKVDYEVDANGFISKLITLDDQELIFKRNAYGQEIIRKLPGGTQMEQKWDISGRLTEQYMLVHGRISVSQSNMYNTREMIRRSYTYNSNGALIRTVDGHWGQVEYNYDPAERLLSAIRERGVSENFQYDLTGNITHVEINDENFNEENFIYTPGNRLLQKGNTKYEYDAEGRRVKKIEYINTKLSKIWEFQWDTLDRLVSVTKPDGQVWCYHYDALSRRVAKIRSDQETQSARVFIWDKDIIIQEVNGQQPLSSWIFDFYTFEAIATVQNSSLFTVINDHLLTPKELVDSQNQIAWSSLYNSWGKRINQTATKNIYCPITLPGQWFDEDSLLSYSRFRHYDPETGSFISRDPIGLIGGINQYFYGPNPINWIDPLGLAFSSGRPPHEATATVWRSSQDGNRYDMVSRSPYQSGNMTPEERSLGFPRSSLATHTENRAVRNTPLLSSDVMVIHGQYPPCTSCKGAINRATRAAPGARVIYLWHDEDTGDPRSWESHMGKCNGG